MANSVSPIQVSVPTRTVALLLNVVMPPNREQGGVKDRFRLVFYRNNVKSKSRVVFLKGPKVVTVASPSMGISWVISFKLWPMGIKNKTQRQKAFGSHLVAGAGLEPTTFGL